MRYLTIVSLNLAGDSGIWPVLGNIFQDDFLSKPLGGVIVHTEGI